VRWRENWRNIRGRNKRYSAVDAAARKMTFEGLELSRTTSI
jgi:hypothetical protein